MAKSNLHQLLILQDLPKYKYLISCFRTEPPLSLFWKIISTKCKIRWSNNLTNIAKKGLLKVVDQFFLQFHPYNKTFIKEKGFKKSLQNFMGLIKLFNILALSPANWHLWPLPKSTAYSMSPVTIKSWGIIVRSITLMP